MNSFHKIVITISIIVLIISLIILSLFLTKSLFEDSYPPVISDCPDYWDVSYNNNEVLCVNTSTININTSDIDCSFIPVNRFKINGSQEDDILCNKYEWAKKCNTSWDGVTNNNKACNIEYY